MEHLKNTILVPGSGESWQPWAYPTCSIVGLTDEGIAQLSPAAAAVSKLIKTDMSLTRCYSELVKCKEDLLKSEAENRRYKSYLDSILKDIKRRTPELKHQRDEFESTVDKLRAMEDELRAEKDSHERTREQREIYKRRDEDLAAENERLNCQV